MEREQLKPQTSAGRHPEPKAPRAACQPCNGGTKDDQVGGPGKDRASNLGKAVGQQLAPREAAVEGRAVNSREVGGDPARPTSNQQGPGVQQLACSGASRQMPRRLRGSDGRR